MKKKILFLTGTRADYGKLKPLITVLEADSNFESSIFVTGMHMDIRYGLTVDEVIQSGFGNIHVYQNKTNGEPMEAVLANTVIGMSHHVAKHCPDLIVVHGDRVEPLAGAIVGTLRNILVAHVEGGEVSGTVDEALRHSITKLSHLHFTSNERTASRLIQMGENADSIFIIGSPDIDIMLSDTLPKLEDMRRRYAIDFPEFGVVLFHPVTTDPESLQAQRSEALVGALLASEFPYVVIYPNNDLGSEVILDAYKRLEGLPRFRIFPSMRFEYFLTLLKHCRCLVGTSSAGIREAPVFGIPSINIGTRQQNRFCHTSIANVSCDQSEILAALKRSWHGKRHAPCLHFGQGQSAQRFLQALRNPTLWEGSRQKSFCDTPLFPGQPLWGAGRGGQSA